MYIFLICCWVAALLALDPGPVSPVEMAMERERERERERYIYIQICRRATVDSVTHKDINEPYTYMLHVEKH